MSDTEQRINLLNMTPQAARAALAEFFERAGQPRYRAEQVVRRLWLNPVPGFDDMTELPKALRETLAASFELPRLDRRRATEVGRRDREVSLSSARWRGDRDRGDP